MVVWLTDGNASSVIHPILLMKFIAAILHSKESTWKWSRTSNVNRVWGFLKLARNSLAWMKCWSHSSDDLTQWHHQNEHLKIPVEDTTISSNWDQKFVPDSCVYVGLDWLTRSSISSNISRLDGLLTSTLSGMEEQLSGWWGRCIVSLPWRRSDFWENCPFHIWIRWKGWFCDWRHNNHHTKCLTQSNHYTDVCLENWFVLEKFDKNSMSLTNILFKEFILSLSGIVRVNLIQRNIHNTFP